MVVSPSEEVPMVVPGSFFPLKGGSVGGEATTNGVAGGPNIFLLTTVADYL